MCLGDSPNPSTFSSLPAEKSVLPGEFLLIYPKIFVEPPGVLQRGVELESRHCFIVFGWIKLKFGVKGNFRFLIPNLHSKTQYQFEILRKCHFCSLRS